MICWVWGLFTLTRYCQCVLQNDESSSHSCQQSWCCCVLITLAVVRLLHTCTYDGCELLVSVCITLVNKRNFFKFVDHLLSMNCLLISLSIFLLGCLHFTEWRTSYKWGVPFVGMVSFSILNNVYLAALGLSSLYLWLEGLVALRHVGYWVPSWGSNPNPLRCKADS